MVLKKLVTLFAMLVVLVADVSAQLCVRTGSRRKYLNKNKQGYETKHFVVGPRFHRAAALGSTNTGKRIFYI